MGISDLILGLEIILKPNDLEWLFFDHQKTQFLFWISSALRRRSSSSNFHSTETETESETWKSDKKLIILVCDGSNDM